VLLRVTLTALILLLARSPKPPQQFPELIEGINADQESREEVKIL